MLALVLAAVLATAPAEAGSDLNGAWKHVREDGTIGAWIITDGHFSIAWYRSDPAKFVSTEGGVWSKAEDGGIRLTYEFDTANPDRVGTSRTIRVEPGDGRISADGAAWTRIDDGAPGALEGSWLMTGRKRDGEISTRRPGARRTMKILSGTRFQWIAYNVETKEFFGSGGGTYNTADGKYNESIEFFSRDDTRTGRNLEFQYDMVEGVWHHIGKSTAGEPMHEVWNRRKDLGI
ncbi:MAG: membrane or secreted protein [Acidobacteriota bacterium]|nr:membrane or secreted protein [Acidobacteriota bacterium]